MIREEGRGNGDSDVETYAKPKKMRKARPTMTPKATQRPQLSHVE